MNIKKEATKRVNVVLFDRQYKMLKALENQIYKDCKKKTHGRDKRSELIRNALDEVYTDHRKRLVLQIKEAKKIVGKLAIEFNTTFPGEELGEMLDYYEEEED